MKPIKSCAQSGFSVTEMLIVIAVLGILTTFALIQTRTSKTDFERQRIARELKVYLERARFDSVKRRADVPAEMARIVFTSPTKFTATMDFNSDGRLTNPTDGTPEAGDTRTVDFTQRSGTEIKVSNTLNYPITVIFDRRGHVTTTDGGNNPVAPVFSICNDCSTSTTDRTVIAVSTSGTVAVLPAGQSPSALPTPTTTEPTAVLNCYLLTGAAANSTSCIEN